ncbi:MAG TPA: hypothetical protein VMW16_04515 [Sedimentisphaerales bacterium]|nr:hypothetical protein [Sedimentisphaerales bacterium]
MKPAKKKPVQRRLAPGSALILAVVLTSLLAIIGVTFMLVMRVDRTAATAMSESKELNQAVETVLAKISDELVLDLPGRLPEEYYDYPDANNRWLACLEPEIDDKGTPAVPADDTYYWRQTSDPYGVLSWPLITEAKIVLPDDMAQAGQPADADGDGVSDSRWIRLPVITSSKGRPIYAAIRVIDNGGMINVNTAYKFDPCNPLVTAREIDGSSLMQVNLAALSQRGVMNGPLDVAAAKLQNWRCAPEPPDLALYEQNVIWCYNDPRGLYSRFDISDELKLRNRYILNYNFMTSRIERLWTRVYDGGLRVPRMDVAAFQSDPAYWFFRSNNSSADPCEYDYRHISTTYNMDRIIGPDGGRLANVNIADVPSLYYAIRQGLLDAGVADANAAAQIAVNVKDSRDGPDYPPADLANYDPTDEVTAFVNPDNGIIYYGFERPCVYISELAFGYKVDPNDPNLMHKSYAIELYKPYFEDSDPCRWRLVIPGFSGSPVDVNWSGTAHFHVIKWETPVVPLTIFWTDPKGPDPADGAMGVNPKIQMLIWPAGEPWVQSYNVYLGTDSDAVKNADTSSPEFKGNEISNSHTLPAPLEYNQTYYWRIDDVNGADVRAGEVWSFTTAGPEFSEPNVQLPGSWDAYEPVFVGGRSIELQRFVAQTGTFLPVDQVSVPDTNLAESKMGTRSYQRDITLHKCIRRLWPEPPEFAAGQTLGYTNSFRSSDANMVQAHPANKGLTNIGQIGSLFWMPVPFNKGVTESDVRVNLANPAFQHVLDYLTVFDPSNDGIDNDGEELTVVLDPETGQPKVTSRKTDEIDPNLTPELKIPGRININTAPWYVIAQLPWMTPPLAQAIVKYRDKLPLWDTNRLPPFLIADYTDRRAATAGPPDMREEPPGFASVAELANVVNLFEDRVLDPCYPNFSMRYYLDGLDQAAYPDLTFADGAPDDFEERDLILARISNLVTVRSDVFTAYILVRIGVDGPQKRVVAILDRSNVYPVGGNIIGQVKRRAVHPAPDPW